MTALPSTPNSSALSRYLSKTFPRSQRCGPTNSPGFVVRPALGRSVRDTDWVVVEYEPGTRLARLGTTEGLLKLCQDALREYERHLKDRYSVARNDEGGPDDWNCLLVRTKKESS